MTGLVRKATLLSGAMLMIASAAMAGVPSAANSLVVGGIQMGGTAGGIVTKARSVWPATTAVNSCAPLAPMACAVASAGANTTAAGWNTEPLCTSSCST